MGTMTRGGSAPHRESNPGTEVVGMATKTHDRIVVESEKVGRPAREGDVLEVIEASYGTRYRVAWDDGHESVYTPADGALRPDASAGRSA